jgi:hypothetical protein
MFEVSLSQSLWPYCEDLIPTSPSVHFHIGGAGGQHGILAPLFFPVESSTSSSISIPQLDAFSIAMIASCRVASRRTRFSGITRTLRWDSCAPASENQRPTRGLGQARPTPVLFSHPVPAASSRRCALPVAHIYIATRPQLTKGTLPGPSGLKPERALGACEPPTAQGISRKTTSHVGFLLLLRRRAGVRARRAGAERVRALRQASGPRQRHLHVPRRHALLQRGVPIRADAARRHP